LVQPTIILVVTDRHDAAPARRDAAEHRRLIVLIMGLMLAQMMAAIEGTVVSTALPTIATELGGFDLIPWVYIAYLLTATATTPLWGKLSDLYGRTRLYQGAIVVFIVGSVLAGAATSMQALVAARAIQGVGAGGLFALSMTILGDVISPRERGRYQGYMAGVFSVATILGPLVGGLLVDFAHWRWIFFMNLPLGIAGLVVSHRTLRLPFTRRQARIDVVGSVSLLVWVTALVVETQLGGSRFPWASPTSIALIVLALGGLAVFVDAQRRAPEPLLPPHLFREPLFTLGNGLSFLLGFGMFATTLSAPLFLQIVVGVNATRSGLLIVPMTLGMLLTSVASGNLMTRTGRYRPFPIIGTGLMVIGSVLLAGMGVGTGAWTVAAWMFVFGMGVGGAMQVVMTAIQSRVTHADLGVATSATNFARSLGSTIGSAVLGAVLIARLDHWLPRLVPDAAVDAASLSQGPAEIRAMPPAMRQGVVEAFARSLDTVFMVAVPVCILAFALAWLLPEYPLRDDAAVPTADLGEGEEVAALGATGVIVPEPS
jgi:EmrB/QacA subfamily drug resistance transporter